MGTQIKGPKIPIEKQLAFIEEFKKIRPLYIEYAGKIETILNEAVESLSMLAIVQARTKSIVSFSNKIINKDKYLDPLVEMTDLCGLRVIVHFQSQVEKICTFIKENFEIDEPNSLDARSRLQVNEFGYRSIHYIISPKKNKILGVVMDKKFKNLKAEIQVRTLAEHMWADISHDRIYKTDLNIPDEWKRVAARLSAMLENADNIFAGMSSEIDSLATVYELQYETGKAETDIEKLKTLISVLHKNPYECINTSIKLSSIYRAKDDFAEAVELLKPLRDGPVKCPVLKGRLWFEYGMVLAQCTGGDIDSPGYAKGSENINQALRIFDKLNPEVKKENEEVLSYIYFRYGKLLQRNVEENRNMSKYFNHAHGIMPENPLYLVTLMESLALCNLDIAKHNISLFKANISQAIPKLKELIEIGIKRVHAFFAIGHCYLLLDEEAGCINAYANAIENLLNGKYLTSHATIDAEIALIGRLKDLNPKLSEQVKLYLNIAMFIVLGAELMEWQNKKGKLEKELREILEQEEKTEIEKKKKEEMVQKKKKELEKGKLKEKKQKKMEKKYKKSLKTRLIKHKLKEGPFKSSVVIVAGGASNMDESKLDDYSNYVRELMHEFKGTIISGGTKAGIPGLVGQVKADLQKEAPVDFDLLAYLPEILPDDAVKSRAYDEFYETSSDSFSALDILVCWANLINNGINPKDVILIGIDGGEIATMEYRIALSLGAKVGLVTYSGRAVTDFLLNKTWKNHPNLLQIPKDPLTVWALVNQSAKTILSKEEIEILAPIAHDFYMQKGFEDLNPKSEDINKFKVLMPWNKLDPTLQDSNLKQVAFYEHILKRVGLSIRKSAKPVKFIIKKSLEEPEYDLLAQLEHARWNAERLLEGWKYGPEKDIRNKLNPCIVAWKKLDEETREYDYGPVDNIPLLLAKIGYEVYKKDSKPVLKSTKDQLP